MSNAAAYWYQVQELWGNDPLDYLCLKPTILTSGRGVVTPSWELRDGACHYDLHHLPDSVGVMTAHDGKLGDVRFRLCHGLERPRLLRLRGLRLDGPRGHLRIASPREQLCVPLAALQLPSVVVDVRALSTGEPLELSAVPARGDTHCYLTFDTLSLS